MQFIYPILVNLNTDIQAKIPKVFLCIAIDLFLEDVFLIEIIVKVVFKIGCIPICS
jgi:hypothetical protein